MMKKEKNNKKTQRLKLNKNNIQREPVLYFVFVCHIY